MFAGFRSRCTMPCAWAEAKPSATAAAKPDIARAINLSHAAGIERCDDLVGTEKIAAGQSNAVIGMLSGIAQIELFLCRRFYRVQFPPESCNESETRENT